MIAIDVTMAPINETLVSTAEDFSLLSGPLTAGPEFETVVQSYAEIYNFFKDCIDKNFILNTVNMSRIESTSQTSTRYYAITSENAQAFQDAFTNMDVDFSMKKLWAENGFNVLLTQSEIDFDFVENNFELIDQDNRLWSFVEPSN